VETAHALLKEWEAFYVIVGSSAGALTGLLFVVITLAADSKLPRTPDTVNAFTTPNVIHFAAVLLLSAILTAPWRRMPDPAHLVGAIAIAGVIYVLVVTRRMMRQKTYKPVLEDWVWHLVLPMIAYAGLFIGAAGLSHDQPWATFLIGGVNILLIGIGIHNAWDTVIYIVANRDTGEHQP
jgi:hypothetical protein